MCSYGCVVGQARVWGPAWRCPLPPFSLYKPVLTDPLHIRKSTQKSKFLLSQAFKWKKNMFLVIPEMPSKTFVMVLKKNFLITLKVSLNVHIKDMDWFLSLLPQIKSYYHLKELRAYTCIRRSTFTLYAQSIWSGHNSCLRSQQMISHGILNMYIGESLCL